MDMKTRTLWIVFGLGLAMLLSAIFWPRKFGLDWIEHAPTVLLGFGGFALLIAAMAGLPSQIAKSRGHPSADAIGMCSIVGVVFFPIWLVALLWAYSNPRA